MTPDRDFIAAMSAGIPPMHPDPIAADEAEHGPCAQCETCSGNGMIGGPSYREPDEGGVPCPDCAPHWAANLPTLSPDEIAEGDARQEHC